MALRFLMLGSPEIRMGQGRTLAPEPRQGTLFMALAVNANAPVPLDRLARALWAEPPSSAARLLHSEVAILRQSIDEAQSEWDGSRLLWRRDGYLLLIEDDELDLDRFTLLFRQGRAALDADDHWAAAFLLGEALALWRGPAGLGCEPFGWLRRRLADLNELRWSAVEGRLVALLKLGRTAQAVSEARAMLDLDPLHEPWWACLIAGLQDAGEAGAAQQAHDQARRTFTNESGVLPDDVRRLFHVALLPSRVRGNNWIRQNPLARPLSAARAERAGDSDGSKTGDRAAL